MVDVDMLFNEPSLGALIAKELYEAGANSIVIESKKFPKVNSLTPDHIVVNTPEEFARMINKVKSVFAKSDNFQFLPLFRKFAKNGKKVFLLKN